MTRSPSESLLRCFTRFGVSFAYRGRFALVATLMPSANVNTLQSLDLVVEFPQYLIHLKLTHWATLLFNFRT